MWLFNWFHKQQGEKVMAKKDVIAQAVADMAKAEVAAQEAAFGKVYDAGALEQKGMDGKFGQGDIDKAVHAAVDPLLKEISELKAKDAKDAADGAAAHKAMAELQSKFDDVSKKYGADEAEIKGLSGSLQVFKDIVAKLSGIKLP